MTLNNSKVIIFVMRSPFLEKVPNLMFILRFLLKNGYKIFVVASSDEDYPAPIINLTNLKIINIGMMNFPFRIPTTLLLFYNVVKVALKNSTAILIGGDYLGNFVAGCLKRFLRMPHVNYVLEYPKPKGHCSRLMDKMEHFLIRQAEIVITFDNFHKNFLVKETGTSKDKIFTLPGGSGNREEKKASNFLATKFNLSSKDIIILHSGGFGPYFCCKEIALASKKWASNRKLIFHTSHFVDKTPYAIEFRKANLSRSVLIHDKPVPDSKLDELVSSAHIGLAIYSLKILGFRAEGIGLAAGKIGRYLKNGIPVIATNVPSLKEYIEGYKCGICVDHEEEINNAISKILKNYKLYSDSACRCYDEIWDMDKHCLKILKAIKQL